MTKVLFIDDVFSEVAGYIATLKDSKFSVIFSENYDSAKEVITKERSIDIIITDIRIGERTGFELIHFIKSQNIDIPIILITGHGWDYHGDAIKSGAYWYLMKGRFDNDELTALIERAVSDYSTRKDLANKNLELQKLSIELGSAKGNLEVEKNNSEKILYSILPAEIVKQLIKWGKTFPKCYEEVSVLFADLVDFSQISKKMKPDILIKELNDIFESFDNIMRNNKCERIKTLGDGYLGVAGIPVDNKNHAVAILKASKSMIEYLTARNANEKINWEIRIGIHSGSVIAGTVGNYKYNYDIFGSTVNDAQRILSVSSPMRIAVSKTTYNILKRNKEFKFIDKGIHEVKHKQKLHIYEFEK